MRRRALSRRLRLPRRRVVGAGLDAAGTPTATPTAELPEERVECVGLFRLDDDVDPNSPSGTPRETETGAQGGG